MIKLEEALKELAEKSLNDIQVETSWKCRVAPVKDLNGTRKMGRKNLYILKKENSIYSHVIEDDKKRRYRVWIFKCLRCDNTLRVKANYINKSTGLCRYCTQRKSPFVSIFRGMRYSAKERGIECTLTFQEFLEFTGVKNCHYCDDDILWKPYRDSGTTSFRYFLDRKNSDLVYFKENLVVCCPLCNYVKSDRFTYEEFLLLAPVLKNIRRNRNVGHRKSA